MPRDIVAFVVLTYVASHSVAITIAQTGGDETLPAILMLLGMLAPALAAVVVRLVFAQGFGDVRWSAFSWSHAALGMLLFPLLSALAVSAYLLASGGGIAWANWLTPTADGLIHPLAASGLGEPFPAAELQAKLVKKLVLNLPIMCVFTLGEEYGWRSFLQTRLASRYGARKAIVVTALVWGYWHLGYMLLDSGDLSDPGNLAAAVLLGPLALSGVGIVFGWLYHRSGSLLVVVLAHAALNKWSGVTLRYLEQPGEMGGVVALSLANIVIGALWLWKMKIDEADAAS